MSYRSQCMCGGDLVELTYVVCSSSSVHWQQRCPHTNRDRRVGCSPPLLPLCQHACVFQNKSPDFCLRLLVLHSWKCDLLGVDLHNTPLPPLHPAQEMTIPAHLPEAKVCVSACVSSHMLTCLFLSALWVHVHMIVCVGTWACQMCFHCVWQERGGAE